MMTATEQAVHVFSMKVLVIHTLRINVKSLAAEAKINRQEMRRCGPHYRCSLSHHRREDLRDAARITHLALNFVRGTPYKSVEQKPDKYIPLGPVMMTSPGRLFPKRWDGNWNWTPDSVSEATFS